MTDKNQASNPKHGVPVLTQISYVLHVDGVLVGYVSDKDFKTLTADRAPQWVSVSIHNAAGKFVSPATINTKRISWLELTKVTPA